MNYVNKLSKFFICKQFLGFPHTYIKSGLVYAIISLLFIFSFMPSPLCLETPDMRVAPTNPAFTRYFQTLSQDTSISQLKRSRSLRQTSNDSDLGLIPDPLSPERHDSNLSPTETFPVRFDLRDPDGDNDPSDSPLSPVRDQGACGACWTFATFGSLESHLKQSFQLDYDFSEDHLRHMHGFDLLSCAGGNLKMGVAYLTSHLGPILEINDPYSDNVSSEFCIDCSPARYIDQTVFLPVRENTSDIAYIKKEIIENGALYTSMFMNQAVFYDQNNHTYFYDDPSDTFNQSNHAVVIVGWDDEKTVTGAPGDGAFIVRNSMGSSWGDQGYFYVSYYDESIAMTRLGYFQDKDDTHYSFDTIYQYDPLGWTGGIGTGDGKDWASNVFTASEDIEITAIGFYATRSSTNYSIQIYENFEDLGGYSRPGGPLLDTEQTGFLKYSGFYTIQLTQPVIIKQGKKFAVTIAFESPENAYPVPIETPINNYSSGATAQPGESYVSDYGDIYFDIINFSANSNVCIKAYAKKMVQTPPTADPKQIETNEDTSVQIELTGSSENSQNIIFIIRSHPMHGSLSGDLPNLTYTPDKDFYGEDSFLVQANDGFSTSEPSLIQITVQPINDPPVAWNLNLMGFEDIALPILSPGMDPDGDILTFNLLSPPTNGLIVGDFSDLTYMPAGDYHGVDSFTFQINDGNESSETAQINLTFEPVNDIPFAKDQTINLLEDHSVALTLSGSDIDSPQIDFQILTQPQFGHLTGEPPILVYTPNHDFHGVDHLIYQINDGQDVSNQITVEFQVSSVIDNNPPIAESKTLLVYAGEKNAITLTGTDIDGDPLQYLISDLPKNGIITGNGPVFYYTSTNLSAINDLFTYKVNDGQEDSPLGSIRLIILQSNHVPLANSFQIETMESTSVSLTLTGSDPDNDPLSYVIAVMPLHGSLSGTAPFLSYLPSPNYSGTDIFMYYVNDGLKKSSFASVRITIHPKPFETKPIAYTQSLSIQEDISLAITLTGSDPKGLTLNYYIKAQPIHGQLSGTPPLLTYTPNSEYSGSDGFYFQVGNGQELSDTVPIILTIITVNDPPTAESQTIITGKNQSVAINMSAHDPDSENIEYHLINGPYSGSLIGSFPNVVFRPNFEYTGTDYFVFSANDGLLNSEPATISITILPFQVIQDDPEINRGAPVISNINDKKTTIDNTTDGIYFTVNTEAGLLTLTCEYSNTSLITDTGIEICSVQTTTYTLNTAGGVDENITLTILPASSASGSSNVTITVTDSNNLTATQSFTLWVLKPGAGYAVQYDGDDDYFDTYEDTGFRISTGTFEAWFYAYTYAAYDAIWSKYAGNYSDDIYTFFWANGQLHLGQDKDSNSTAYNINSDVIVSINTWYHVAVLWGTGGLKMYINGELQTETNAIVNNVIAAGASLQIGKRNAATFNGIIDEARIWSTRRTQTEIRENMYVTLNGNETGLVSAWSFNEGDGISSLDISSNQYNGTLVNAPQWITSTAPIGLTATMLTEASGSKTFTDTGVTMYFNTEDGSSVQVSKIADSPNVDPTGVKEVFDNQYWLVKRYSATGFDAHITFSLTESLTTTDESDPSVLTLYTRGLAATGSWTAVTSASSVDASGGTVTFNNITSLGQFIVARGNRIADSITLSKNSINQNVSEGTTIGTLSNNDADPTDSFVYSLEAGTGDDDNASFTISENALKTNTSFDYDTKNVYSIRIQVSDSYDTYAQVFTININKSYISPSRMTTGNVGFCLPDADKGKSVGDGNVSMNVSNPSMSFYSRLTVE
ncbi:protein containing Peptidase C1A, papain [Candidatus Magnetomorum sp. HK-1]|nr:protein containing Peptidase C1A, papain [Candidatus Magnetomorum sp. HK-1]